MRLIPLALMLVAIPSLLTSQEPASSSSSGFGPRKVTATAGLGNAMGWYGGQAELYFARGRLSAFAGLGYTPSVDPGDPEGLTGALGLRGYTPGRKHRGLLELSVSQIATRRSLFGEGDRLYGPGVQAGYQFVSRGGFTAMVSLGAGYAPGAEEGETHGFPLIGLGLGYTWRSDAVSR